MARAKQAVIERQAVALAKQYQAFKVTDVASCEAAEEALKKVKRVELAWDAFMDPQIAEKRGALEATKQVKFKLLAQIMPMKNWLQEQVGAFRRKLDAKEDRAQVQAEGRAEEDAKEERARQIKMLKDAGRNAEALALSRRPLTVAPVVARIERPKSSGVAVRELWDFRITDEALIPREYLVPDEVAIGKVVRAMKANTRIAGVEVFAKNSVAVSVDR